MPACVGLSKISVQTGTAHGGFINADGTLRMDVKIDLKTLEELSRVARKDYGLGGAVQHGASTLPPEAFDAFPRAGACEIHLATDFQNMVYEHPQFPADLKAEMYAWIRENATRRAEAEGHRGAVHLQGAQEGDRPVQAADVEPRARRQRRAHRPVARGALLVPDEAAQDRRHRQPSSRGSCTVPQIPIDREAEIVAAGGKITAAEKKAEGLAD